MLSALAMRSFGVCGNGKIVVGSSYMVVRTSHELPTTNHVFRLDPDNVYRAESFGQFPWLEHGFGTRLSNGWPDMSRLVSPRQIHSDKVLIVPKGAPTGDVRLGQGDALVTEEPGVLAGIRTADCLPILLVDAVGQKVGAIHAGWRGTVAEITARADRKSTRLNSSHS